MSNKDDIAESLERINKELKAFKNANDTIEQIYAKSKETDKKEERKFQVRILEIQLRHDIITSSLTAIIAVAFAFLVLSLTIINSSDIPVPTKQLLLPYIIPLFVGGVIAFAVLLAVSFVEIQWREIKNLKKDFVENKDPETKVK